MTDSQVTRLTSPQNPRIKDVVKLRKRSYRDEAGVVLIEGYRELRRALDNHWKIESLFYAPGLFLGENEGELIDTCREQGASLFECTEPIFQKIAYRDRPDGLLALAQQVRVDVRDIQLPKNPLIVVAESIEKPGNLGTILRSADAAGVDAVIVCSGCTDIYNPNTVRASIGTLFALPVCEADTEEIITWLNDLGAVTVAATPHADTEYTAVDMTGATAIIVGAEQYGISPAWMERSNQQVRIPMLGQCDSLNVAAATTIMLYEAVRQRRVSPIS